MHAIDFLERQHDEVSALFGKVDETERPGELRKLFERLADALAAHAMLEEKVFYPAVHTAVTERMLLQQLEENLEIKRHIADLLELPPSSESYRERLRSLRKCVEHHVAEERADLFPRSREVLDPAQMEAIGELMEAVFDEMKDTAPRLGVLSQTSFATLLS